MVASTHNLDDLNVNHPANASDNRQQQQRQRENQEKPEKPEKNGKNCKTPQTGQDKRSRLSNVINNLRKKVSENRGPESPRKHEDDERNSVERNLETLEKYVMTVLNGVIKDQEENNEAEGKGKCQQDKQDRQEKQEARGCEENHGLGEAKTSEVDVEPSKPRESRTQEAEFVGESCDSPTNFGEQQQQSQGKQGNEESCGQSRRRVDEESCGQSRRRVDEESCGQSRRRIEEENGGQSRRRVDEESCGQSRRRLDEESCGQNRRRLEEESCGQNRRRLEEESCGQSRRRLDEESCGQSRRRLEEENCGQSRRRIEENPGQFARETRKKKDEENVGETRRKTQDENVGEIVRETRTKKEENNVKETRTKKEEDNVRETRTNDEENLVEIVKEIRKKKEEETVGKDRQVFEEKVENRSLGTIIMERLNDHQTTEESNNINQDPTTTGQTIPEHSDLRVVCRELLNDLLNGLNQSSAGTTSVESTSNVETSKTSLHCSLPLDKVASVLQNCQSTDLVASQSSYSVQRSVSPVSRPTGSSSTVSRPTGSSSTVSRPTGSSSTVSKFTGSSSTVSKSTGSSSTVSRPTGSSSTVSRPTGSSSTVSRPTGSSSTVSKSTGSSSTVSKSTGSSSTVSRPTTSFSTVSGLTMSPSTVSRPTTSSSTVSRPTTSSSTVSRPTTSSSTVPRPTTSSSTLSRPTTSSSTVSRQTASMDERLGTKTTAVSSSTLKSTAKPPSPTVRHLCLYCDRKFLSISLRQRHTERVHQLGGGRRSERNSRKPSQNCQYCSDKCPENLEGLFQHMVGNHSDKYHACVQCSTRYLTKEALVGHANETHGSMGDRNQQNQEKTKETSACKDFGSSSPREKVEPVSIGDRISEEAETETRVETSLHKYMNPPSKDSFANPASPEFDSTFYSSVSCNIRENLLHHLDGKLETNSTISNTTCSTTETKQQQGSNQQQSFYEHGINQIQFPIDISLTAATPVYNKDYTNEEYENSSEYAQKAGKTGRSHPRRVSFEKYNFPRKYDTKEQWTCSIKDLSKFDISTQLSLRKKQQLIKERITLNRLQRLPNLKQSTRQNLTTEIETEKGEEMGCIERQEATILSDKDLESNVASREFSTRQQENNVDANVDNVGESCTEFTGEFGNFMRLRRWQVSSSNERTNNTEIVYAELTGEWSRPRVYICGACNAKHVTLKEMEDHKSSAHPNVWCSHFEFSGDQRELYKHLFLPGRSVPTAKAKNAILSEKVCTKCSKNCNSLAELHRHMLECAGDQAWLLGLFGNGKKKCKWRPFGSRSRSRRRRQRGMKRNIQNSQTPRVNVARERQPPGPRVRPSDRESIQKMLANLPAKRTTRKVLQDSGMRQQGRLRNVRSKSGPRIIAETSSSRISRNKAALRNKLLKNAKSIQRNRCRSDNISAVIESVVSHCADEGKQEKEKQETALPIAGEKDDNLTGNIGGKVRRNMKVLGRRKNVKMRDLRGFEQTRTREKSVNSKLRIASRNVVSAKRESTDGKLQTSNANEEFEKTGKIGSKSTDKEFLVNGSTLPSPKVKTTPGTPKKKRPVDPVASLNASIKAKSQLRTQDGKFARNPNKDSTQKNSELKAPSINSRLSGLKVPQNQENLFTENGGSNVKTKNSTKGKNDDKKIPRRLTRLSSDSDKMPTLEPQFSNVGGEESVEKMAGDLPILSPVSVASTNFEQKNSRASNSTKEDCAGAQKGQNRPETTPEIGEQKPRRGRKKKDSQMTLVTGNDVTKVGKKRGRKSAPAKFQRAENSASDGEEKIRKVWRNSRSVGGEVSARKEKKIGGIGEKRLETRSLSKNRQEKRQPEVSEETIIMPKVPLEVKKLLGPNIRATDVNFLANLALQNTETGKRVLRQSPAKYQEIQRRENFENFGEIAQTANAKGIVKKERSTNAKKTQRNGDKKQDNCQADVDKTKMEDNTSEKSSTFDEENKNGKRCCVNEEANDAKKDEIQKEEKVEDIKCAESDVTDGRKNSDTSNDEKSSSPPKKEEIQKEEVKDVVESTESDVTDGRKNSDASNVEEICEKNFNDNGKSSSPAKKEKEEIQKVEKIEDVRKSTESDVTDGRKNSGASNAEEIGGKNSNDGKSQEVFSPSTPRGEIFSSSVDSGKENSRENSANGQRGRVGRPRRPWAARKERLPKRSLNDVIGILTEGANIPTEVAQSAVTAASVDNSDAGNSNDNNGTTENRGENNFNANQPEAKGGETLANGIGKISETGKTISEEKSPTMDIILDLSRRKQKGKGSFLEKIVSKIAKQKDALLEGEVASLLDNAADELTSILDEVGSPINAADVRDRKIGSRGKTVNDHKTKSEENSANISAPANDGNLAKVSLNSTKIPSKSNEEVLTHFSMNSNDENSTRNSSTSKEEIAAKTSAIPNEENLRKKNEFAVSLSESDNREENFEGVVTPEMAKSGRNSSIGKNVFHENVLPTRLEFDEVKSIVEENKAENIDDFSQTTENQENEVQSAKRKLKTNDGEVRNFSTGKCTVGNDGIAITDRRQIAEDTDGAKKRKISQVIEKNIGKIENICTNVEEKNLDAKPEVYGLPKNETEGESKNVLPENVMENCPEKVINVEENQERINFSQVNDETLKGEMKNLIVESNEMCDKEFTSETRRKSSRRKISLTEVPENVGNVENKEDTVLDPILFNKELSSSSPTVGKEETGGILQNAETIVPTELRKVPKKRGRKKKSLADEHLLLPEENVFPAVQKVAIIPGNNAESSVRVTRQMALVDSKMSVEKESAEIEDDTFKIPDPLKVTKKRTPRKWSLVDEHLKIENNLTSDDPGKPEATTLDATESRVNTKYDENFDNFASLAETEKLADQTAREEETITCNRSNENSAPLERSFEEHIQSSLENKSLTLTVGTKIAKKRGRKPKKKDETPVESTRPEVVDPSSWRTRSSRRRELPVLGIAEIISADSTGSRSSDESVDGNVSSAKKIGRKRRKNRRRRITEETETDASVTDVEATTTEKSIARRGKIVKENTTKIDAEGIDESVTGNAENYCPGDENAEELSPENEVANEGKEIGENEDSATKTVNGEDDIFEGLSEGQRGKVNEGYSEGQRSKIDEEYGKGQRDKVNEEYFEGQRTKVDVEYPQGHFEGQRGDIEEEYREGQRDEVNKEQFEGQRTKVDVEYSQGHFEGQRGDIEEEYREGQRDKVNEGQFEGQRSKVDVEYPQGHFEGQPGDTKEEYREGQRTEVDEEYFEGQRSKVNVEYSQGHLEGQRRKTDEEFPQGHREAQRELTLDESERGEEAMAGEKVMETEDKLPELKMDEATAKANVSQMDLTASSVAQGEFPAKKRTAGNFAVAHTKTGEILIVEKKKKITKEAARFFCDLCATSFTRKSSLNKHYLSQSHVSQLQNTDPSVTSVTTVSTDKGKGSAFTDGDKGNEELSESEESLNRSTETLEKSTERIEEEIGVPVKSFVDNDTNSQETLEDELLDEEICMITENMSHDEYVLTDQVSPVGQSPTGNVEDKEPEATRKKAEKKKEKRKKKNLANEHLDLNTPEGKSFDFKELAEDNERSKVFETGSNAGDGEFLDEKYGNDGEEIETSVGSEISKTKIDLSENEFIRNDSENERTGNVENLAGISITAETDDKNSRIFVDEEYESREKNDFTEESARGKILKSVEFESDESSSNTNISADIQKLLNDPDFTDSRKHQPEVAEKRTNDNSESESGESESQTFSKKSKQNKSKENRRKSKDAFIDSPVSRSVFKKISKKARKSKTAKTKTRKITGKSKVADLSSDSDESENEDKLDSQRKNKIVKSVFGRVFANEKPDKVKEVLNDWVSKSEDESDRSETVSPLKLTPIDVTSGPQEFPEPSDRKKPSEKRSSRKIRSKDERNCSLEDSDDLEKSRTSRKRPKKEENGTSGYADVDQANTRCRQSKKRAEERISRAFNDESPLPLDQLDVLKFLKNDGTKDVAHGPRNQAKFVKNSREPEVPVEELQPETGTVVGKNRRRRKKHAEDEWLDLEERAVTLDSVTAQNPRSKGRMTSPESEFSEKGGKNRASRCAEDEWSDLEEGALTLDDDNLQNSRSKGRMTSPADEFNEKGAKYRPSRRAIDEWKDSGECGRNFEDSNVQNPRSKGRMTSPENEYDEISAENRAVKGAEDEWTDLKDRGRHFDDDDLRSPRSKGRMTSPECEFLEKAADCRSVERAEDEWMDLKKCPTTLDDDNLQSSRSKGRMTSPEIEFSEKGVKNRSLKHVEDEWTDLKERGMNFEDNNVQISRSKGRMTSPENEFSGKGGKNRSLKHAEDEWTDLKECGRNFEDNGVGNSRSKGRMTSPENEFSGKGGKNRSLKHAEDEWTDLKECGRNFEDNGVGNSRSKGRMTSPENERSWSFDGTAGESENECNRLRMSPMFTGNSSDSEPEVDDYEENNVAEGGRGEDGILSSKKGFNDFQGTKIQGKSMEYSSREENEEDVTIGRDDSLDEQREMEKGSGKAREGKVLNFDEELFVECCSRLKATTENELRGAKKIKLDHSDGFLVKEQEVQQQQHNFRSARDRWRDVESQNSLGSLLESVNQLLGEEMYSCRDRKDSTKCSPDDRDSRSEISSGSVSPEASRMENLGYEDSLDVAFEHNNKLRDKIQRRMRESEDLIANAFAQRVPQDRRSFNNFSRETAKDLPSDDDSADPRNRSERENAQSFRFKGKINTTLGGLLLDKALSNLLHSNGKHDHNGSTPMKVLAELACARAPTSTSPAIEKYSLDEDSTITEKTDSRNSPEPSKTTETKDSLVERKINETTSQTETKKNRNTIKELFERKREINERRQQEKSKNGTTLRDFNAQKQRKPRKTKIRQDFPLIRRNERGGLVERKKRRDGFPRKDDFRANKIKDVYDFDEEESQGEPTTLGSVLPYRNKHEKSYEENFAKKDVDLACLMTKTIGETLENGKTDALGNKLESMIDRKFKEMEKFAPKTKGALKAFHVEEQRQKPITTGPMDEFVERKQRVKRATGQTQQKHGKTKKKGRNPKKKSKTAWYENDSSDEFRTAAKTEDVGVGISKSQRTCSKGKQNLFAELSSSSDSEYGFAVENNRESFTEFVENDEPKSSRIEEIEEIEERAKNGTSLTSLDRQGENWEPLEVHTVEEKCEETEFERSEIRVIVEDEKCKHRNNSDDEEADNRSENVFELDDLYREDSSVAESSDQEEQVVEKKSNEVEENDTTKGNELIPLEEALDLLDGVEKTLRKEESTDFVENGKGKCSSKELDVAEKKNFDEQEEESNEKEMDLPEKLSSNEKPRKESDNLPLHVFLSRKVQESKKRKQQELKKLREEQERILLDFQPTRRQRKCAIGKQGLLAEISSSDDESYVRETSKRVPEKMDHEKQRKQKKESKEKRNERYLEKKHEQMVAKEQKAIEEEILRELGKKKENCDTVGEENIETMEEDEEDVQRLNKQREKEEKLVSSQVENDENEREEFHVDSDSSEKVFAEISRQEESSKSKKTWKTSTRGRKPTKIDVKTTTGGKRGKNSNTEKQKNRLTGNHAKDSKERRSSNGKRDSDDEELKTTKSWNKVEEGVGVAIGRRKRAAANQLYYWSSSSDEEEILTNQPTVVVEEEEDDRQEQHGWIVGDSHKKMITMLAMEKQLKEKRRRSEDEFENGKTKNKKHRNSTS